MNPIRSIDLVIPVFDEEAALPHLFERLAADLAGLAIPWLERRLERLQSSMSSQRIRLLTGGFASLVQRPLQIVPASLRLRHKKATG